MNELSNIFAKNLVKLRKEKKLTQLELANVLNFSDRNVSKWENGQALPTTEVLVELANFFNVSLDYLVTPHEDDEEIKHAKLSQSKQDHLMIFGLSVLCVFLVATIAFVFTPNFWQYSWLSFVYALPASFIISIVFINIWFKKYPFLFIAISLLMWTTLASIYLTLLMVLNLNTWFGFIIGAPLQIGIILWSRFNRYHK